MHRSILVKQRSGQRASSAACLFAGVFMLLQAGVVAADTQEQAEATAGQPEVPAAGGGFEALADVPGVRSGMDREELRELARGKLIDGADHDNAHAILIELLRKDPQDLAALALLAGAYEGKAAAVRGSPDDAAAREADALLDRAVEVYLSAGSLARQKGHDRDAAELYGRILRYRPAHPDALLGLARAFAATQRQMMAIERYRDYLKAPHPTGTGPGGRRLTYADTDSQAHLELGRLYRQANYYGQATASLQAAQRINPQDPEIHVELARTFRETRNYAKAAEAAERAVALGSSNPVYRHTYATILLAQERVGPAIEHASAAVELAKQMLREQPDQPQLLADIQRHYRVYQETLVAHLNREPGDVSARLRLAQAMEEQGELGQLLNLHNVLSMLKSAPQQEAGNLRLLEATARLQFATGGLAEAAETCRRIIQIDSANELAKDLLDRLPPELKGEGSS